MHVLAKHIGLIEALEYSIAKAKLKLIRVSEPIIA